MYLVLANYVASTVGYFPCAMKNVHLQENVHTHPVESHWKFQGTGVGGGVKKKQNVVLYVGNV